MFAFGPIYMTLRGKYEPTNLVFVALRNSTFTFSYAFDPDIRNPRIAETPPIRHAHVPYFLLMMLSLYISLLLKENEISTGASLDNVFRS